MDAIEKYLEALREKEPVSIPPQHCWQGIESVLQVQEIIDKQIKQPDKKLVDKISAEYE